MAAARAPGVHPGRMAVLVVLGAVVGALVGALTYEWVAPLLDRRSDWLREAQGLVWNLVPVLAVAGGVVGHAVARRRGW